MVRFYKMSILFPKSNYNCGGVSMIYTIGDILCVYDFDRQVHYKCTSTTVKRCETINAIQLVERGAYGTTTTVHRYLEEYETEEDYLQEIEKYVMMKELVS